MFFIVCASTPTSSVRVGCPGPVEARAKVQELEDTGVGKVRIFDDVGKRYSLEELTDLVNVPDTAIPSDGGPEAPPNTES